MQEHYSKNYYEDLYGADGLKKFSSHWWAVRFYALLARKWLRRVNGKRFLEIGCGCGYLLAQLERDYETYGLDISDYAVDQCRRFAPRSKCFNSDIEKGVPPELEGLNFDMVLAKYVFEHLQNPAQAMKNVYEKLSPGGILLFSVPNMEAVGMKCRGQDWYAFKDKSHVSLLKPGEWLKMVKSTGFSIEDTFSDGFWDLPYFKGIPGWLQNPVLLVPSGISCITGLGVTPAKYGENLMVIAKKPLK